MELRENLESVVVPLFESMENRIIKKLDKYHKDMESVIQQQKKEIDELRKILKYVEDNKNNSIPEKKKEEVPENDSRREYSSEAKNKPKPPAVSHKETVNLPPVDLQRMTLVELKAEAKKLNLKISGSKKVLRERIKEYHESKTPLEEEVQPPTEPKQEEEETSEDPQCIQENVKEIAVKPIGCAGGSSSQELATISKPLRLSKGNILSARNEKINDTEFFDIFRNSDLTEFKKITSYILTKYGAKVRSNRFMVGISLEYCSKMVLDESGLIVKSLPDAPRIDLDIVNYDPISVKFSSKGDIKLHNSLGANKDTSLRKTLLITLDTIYLISEELLLQVGIDYKNYINSVGDGLKLQRSLLTKLKKPETKYKFLIPCKIFVGTCQHKQAAKAFFKHVLTHYNKKDTKSDD
jgi:hypothetical protein